MKKWLIFIFLFLNIIWICGTQKNIDQKDKISVSTTMFQKFTKNNIKSFINNTKVMLTEENGKLKRKSNHYWIMFLIIAIVSFVISIFYVYQDVFCKRNQHQRDN